MICNPIEDPVLMPEIKKEKWIIECGWKGDVPRFQYCTDKIREAGWKAALNSDEAVRKTVRNNI